MDVAAKYQQLHWVCVHESIHFRLLHGTNNDDASVLLCISLATTVDAERMQLFADAVLAFWQTCAIPTIQIIDIRAWESVCTIGSLLILRDLSNALRDVWTEHLSFTTLLLHERVVSALRLAMQFYRPVRPIGVTSEVDHVLSCDNFDFL